MVQMYVDLAYTQEFDSLDKHQIVFQKRLTEKKKMLLLNVNFDNDVDVYQCNFCCDGGCKRCWTLEERRYWRRAEEDNIDDE